MSKRYSLAVCTAAIVCLAGQAGADGYAGRSVQRGPEPLRAQVMHQPAPDCELVGGDDWYCPPAETHVRRYVDESQTRHSVVRYSTGGSCCLQAAPPPPPMRTVVYKQPAPRDLSIDISGFTGGVGSGVDGGYYGGGGGVFVYASANASASASASASMRFSFKGGFKGKRGKGKKGGGGGCSPCGGK